MTKFISWNVNGIRAQVKKDFIKEYKKSKAHLYCIQETKAQDEQVHEALKDIRRRDFIVRSAEKKGYSGVGIIARETPLKIINGIGIKGHTNEGRVVTVEYEDFQLINVYVPNSGNGLSRLEYRAEWDKAFASFLKKRQKVKPIIVAGDFNVAHQPIDLARPKQNYNKTAGYTQVEIDGIQRILDCGLVDSYRYKNPEKVQYTFWSVRFGARAKNVGWRIDYFLVDDRLKSKILNARIKDKIMGSDHCPIELEMDL